MYHMYVYIICTGCVCACAQSVGAKVGIGGREHDRTKRSLLFVDIVSYTG